MAENTLSVGQNMTLFVRINIQFSSSGMHMHNAWVVHEFVCSSPLLIAITNVEFRHESDVVQEQDPAGVEHIRACQNPDGRPNAIRTDNHGHTTE
jgi:hypothetical protein